MDHPTPSVEMLGLDALIPYANNTRTHSEEQVAQVAASIREFGFTNPVLVDADNGIIAGHGRVLAARKLGLAEVPCIRLAHLDEKQKRAYVIADNKLALNAGWDDELLALELGALRDDGFDIGLTGFSEEELAALVVPEVIEGQTDEDAVPEAPEDPKTVEGDIWVLGRHRLMCGDSTSIDAVERLMDGRKAALLHADPPYGMGKEGDGVANDNLYRDKLDAFQMEWWATFRTFLEDNASAYIWGNPLDLWRLWYCGGLADSEELCLQNEIVWAKPSGFGQSSGEMRSFAINTERCLFFLLGVQGYNNNADNYWEGWEPIRAYLDNERKKSGLTTDQCNKICGKQNMTQSAFTKGGFRLILREDYEALKKAANGKAFKREYDDFKREYDDLKRAFYATRAHFDNTHDNMNEVWTFDRVAANDRHGHATPKPVAMMERVMRSSLPKEGLCAEPFGGSGATLMGAEKTGRTCYTMELQPKYCDVIVKRWQDFTGQKAVHAETGKQFDEL